MIGQIACQSSFVNGQLIFNRYNNKKPYQLKTLNYTSCVDCLTTYKCKPKHFSYSMWEKKVWYVKQMIVLLQQT